MKRSSTQYPMVFLDLGGFLGKAWKEGWLDEYSDEHFLIKALNGKLEDYRGYHQFIANNVWMYNITKENFQVNFCCNLSNKLRSLSCFFGEDKIRDFLKDQMSAGKANYDENQFFRALSEVSVLNFWRMKAVSGEYEPKTNLDKNPEARFYCKNPDCVVPYDGDKNNLYDDNDSCNNNSRNNCNDAKDEEVDNENNIIVDIEVKTPGFPAPKQFMQEYAIPTVLLDDKGKEFIDYCNDHQLIPVLPRINKLKDFLNSAAEKFVPVDHVRHMNLLYINWTFSEFPESSFLEAYGLLANSENGILVNQKIGKEVGINDEVYDKITAVIVYTESLNGLMFGDFRYIWTRTTSGEPYFAAVGLHNKEKLLRITEMNDYRKTPYFPPALLHISKNGEDFSSLMEIIRQHVKR